jgi:hypothetical protein
MSGDIGERRFGQDMQALMASDLPEIEKLAWSFAAITGRVAASARRDIELAVALGDRELKIRHQIRLETMETARRIFQGCHLRVTGKKAWDDSDPR